MLGVLVAAACTFGAFAPAAAETSSGTVEPSAESLRADADAIAGRYFATLSRANELDDEIARTEREVTDLEAEAKEARAAARDRAVIAYRQAGSQLAVVIGSDDVLDAARRSRLIDQVNEHDNDVYARLRRVSSDLQAQRRSLESDRASQADALAALRDQGAAIDAKLAGAARKDAVDRVAAAASAPPTPAPPTDAAPTSTAAPAAPTTPAAPTAPPPAAVPPAPPDYTGSPGTHPHHDDPFLSCVRRRESSGNYGAVNPSGPYLGAYQFLQSTWNAAANHAHRTDLVGVPANLATPYDQDDMAWTLYEWQGAGPWGGGCA